MKKLIAWIQVLVNRLFGKGKGEPETGLFV